MNVWHKTMVLVEVELFILPDACLCLISVCFCCVSQAITSESLSAVVHIFQAAAQKGDGYRGQPSPHSASEMFQGVTILKAVKVCSPAP